MKDIQQKLLATFQVEHREHVEQIRSLLSMIQKTGASPASPELEEVFRRAHSLKGAARAVDLHTIEGLAHRLETLFSRVRQGQCALDRDTTGVVQQVLDASEDCIAALSDNRPTDTVPAALRAIERVLGMESSVAPPPAEPAREQAAAVPVFQPLDTVRIATQSFEGLFRTAGEMVAEGHRQDRVAADLTSLARELTAVAKEGERIRRMASSGSRTVSQRDQARLVSSLDAMEHRLRSVSRQAHSTRRVHYRSSWNLRQLATQLQSDVWQARMVPAESLFEGFRKMMRDLARDEGKQIEFRPSSAGVRADRRVLEALKDPIMHLLRNAVSHGIEPGAERLARRKDRVGQVILRVDADGQRLTIRVQDDGRGVDMARVAEVAVRDGILSAAEAAQRSPEELSRLLFRPGFSTSPSVTSLSGRGMGLSVVYEAIRRLQGELSALPAEGGGTVITISVPLSIATHRLVVVRCGEHTFAIPILGIDRLTRVRVSGIQTMEGKPIILFDERPVPLASIPGLLGLDYSPAYAENEMLPVAVVRSGSRRIALAVDEVVKEIDAVVQDLGPAAGCGGRLASGAVLEEGSIAFVVNPLELIEGEITAQSHWQPPQVKTVATSEPVPGSILVVDDSLTTRTLEKSILEAHGYAVRVAVDGVEALMQLRREAPDLVIADVEMPRLNGFGLLEAMKQDATLSHIPVIIVSSLERREDQERGLALGADAYIVKRKFDQEDLLATIRQIL